MTWIMFQQIAPRDSMIWAVGYMDKTTGHVTSITWYYTEDEARLAHHYLTN